jgi:serine/threonine protein kinase
MGAIYSAHDLNVRRGVVLKVMLDPSTATREQIVRFVHEAQITGQLQHPNIVPVYEIAEDEDNNLFYSMKMIEGQTLQQILAQLEAAEPGALAAYPLPRLLDIFMRACDAVAYAIRAESFTAT